MQFYTPYNNVVDICKRKNVSGPKEYRARLKRIYVGEKVYIYGTVIANMSFA